MKWVLIIWTLWMTDGYPTVDVKHSTVFYPSQHACEFAMAEFVERYEPFLEDGFGYTLKCMEREQWEQQIGSEEGQQNQDQAP